MRRLCIAAIAIVTIVLSTASATMIRQEWHTGVGGSRQAIIDFLVDLVEPALPPDLEEIQDLSSFTGTRDNYVAKFFGWVTVPATGTYQFHYSCDDFGMLYVSQDEEMANAVEVAWVDGWAAIAEWNKYPSQHSASMSLKKGQVMAVMAFFQEAGGGDNMDVGWTGPGLSQDETNPTYLTDYITHIPPTPTKAKNIGPEVDDPDVQRDTDLAWIPGKFAAAHTVYLSTNFNDVNDAAAAALIADGITETVFDPGRLEFGQTYYWRVDEVNSPPDSTVFAGKIWSFTVEPLGYPVPGVTVTASSEARADSLAVNLVNGSGLTDGLHDVDGASMWLAAPGVPAVLDFDLGGTYKLDSMVVWNQNQLIEAILGFGAKDVVVETSTDGTTWSPVEGATTINQGPGVENYAANTTLDMGGATASHVRITISSGHGFIGQVGLAEVRFLFIPTFATRPNPESGATNVAPSVTLSWGRNGREAASHDVYVGTDSNNLSLAGSVSESSFDTLAVDLQLSQSYFWRVDEVNDAMDPSTWTGDVWSFTTADSVVIDDMESYADAEFLEIWATWVDGFGDEANNGALVGANPGIGDFSPESTTVHGDNQSLPIHYDNGAAAQSEATRTFAVSQDWTRAGVTHLVVWFHGTAGNTGQMYLKINGTKIPYDGPAGNIGLAAWQSWSLDLASLGMNLQTVRSLAVGVEGNGARGTLYVDDIALEQAAAEPISEWRVSASTDDAEEHILDGGVMESLTSSDLELGYEGNMAPAALQTIGCRWVGIAVPRGATITEAWVQFSADDVDNPYHALPVSLVITGELSAAPGTFAATAGSISGRATTSAEVVWDIPQWTTVHAMGPEERTPDISSIIQQIVNQPDWSGEAIVLMFADNPANPSEGTRESESFNGSVSDAPLLHISFE